MAKTKKPVTKKPTDRLMLLEFKRQGKVLAEIRDLLDKIWREERA